MRSLDVLVHSKSFILNIRGSDMEKRHSVYLIALGVLISGEVIGGAVEREVSSSYLGEVVMLIMGLTTLIAVSISFWLYVWRKRILSNNETKSLEVCPEVWVQGMRDNTHVIKVQNERIIEQHSDGIGIIRETREIFQKILNTLSKREQEIERLKEGYDEKIFKKFLRRFIQVHQAVVEELQAEKKDENLIFIERLLKNALGECGITIFKPEIGSDGLANQIEDYPEVIPTDNKEKDLRVAEVVFPAYLIEAERETVVVPAKVKIFKYEMNQENQP